MSFRATSGSPPSTAKLLTHSMRGATVAMTTDSLRNVKDRFSEFVDRVNREHERVVVTRNGRPAAILINPVDLDSLDESLEVLGRAEAVRDLVQAESVIEFVTGRLIKSPLGDRPANRSSKRFVAGPTEPREATLHRSSIS